MAGPKADINANVGINLNTGGIDKVVSDLETKITGAIEKITKIGDTAASVGKKVSKKQADDIGQLDNVIKGLQRNLQQVQTLLSAQNRTSANNLKNVLGGGLDDQKIARNVRLVNDFRRSLEDATTPAERLRARINAITTETANLARQGKAQSDQQLRKQEQLNAALKEYESFASRLSSLQTKAGVLNPNGQKQLEGLFLEAQKLKQVFNDLAGDGRRTNFGFLTEAQRSITSEIEKQISALNREEQAEARLLRGTRERAQALLDINSRERQVSLERQATSLASRLTPTQLSYGNSVGEAGLEGRLARATGAYTLAKQRLESALATGSNASEREISKLVSQMEFFDRKIVETIALQGRQARDNLSNIRQEELALDKLMASQDRLNRLNRGIFMKDITRGIRESETALKDFDKQLNSLDANGKASAISKAFNGLLGDGGAGLAARVGIYAIAAQSVYAVVNAFKDGAKFAVEFEDKLDTLQAISGATNTQMVGLSAAILDTGKNSRFALTDIAEATIQLAQAGFTVKDTSVALQDISNFAAASGTSFKESVDLITAALGAFQLQASETSRITDVFTAALNRSKLTSQQIAQAIQYVGTTAYEQNISIEELVATIGSVAQAGVRAGSTLGTGFRQFLVDLSNPTEKLKGELSKLGLTLADVDVKTRGLNPVLKTLADAGFDATQAYAGLEVRAAAFYLAAKNNLDVSKQLQLAETERGVAAEASARAMDSLAAQFQRLQNILGAIAVEKAPLDFFKQLVKEAATLAELINADAEQYKKLKEAQENQDRGEERLESLLVYYYKLADSYENIDTKLYRLATTGSIYAKSADTMAEANERLETATSDASDATGAQANKVREIQTEFQKLLTQGPDIRNDSVQTAIVTNNLTSRFEGLANMLGNSANAYDNLVEAMKRYNSQQLRGLSENASGEAAAARNQFSALTSQGNAQFQALRQNLPSQFQNRFNSIYQQYRAGTPGALSAFNDLSNEVRRASPAFANAATALNNFTQTLAKRNAVRSQGNAARIIAEDAATRANPIFQGVYTNFSEIQARYARASANAAMQSPAERAASVGPVLKDTERVLQRLNNLLADNKNNPRATRNLIGLRDEVLSFQNAARGGIKPTTKETKAAERDANRAEAEQRRKDREARRAQDKFNANELSVSQSQLRSADRQLSSFINAGAQNFGLNKIPDVLKTGDDALAEWIKARKEVLADAITKAGLNTQQIEDLTQAANDEIEAKQRATYQKQMDVIDKAITTYIERIGKSVERQYRNSNLDATNNLNRQNALTTGLNNPLLKGVPAYTKVLQQRRADVAQDVLNRQMIGSRDASGNWTGGTNEVRIEEYNKTIDEAEKKLESLKTKFDELTAANDTIKAAAYADQIAKTSDKIEEQRVKVDELVNSNNMLRAQYEAAALKPQSFGDALSQTADAFRIQNDIGISLKERLFGGMGDALEKVHQSFQTFFTDVMTGAKGVGAAFGDMAKAVVSALVEMAAKAVATQIFGLLLSFIPGAKGAPTAGPRIGTTGGLSGLWNGGEVGKAGVPKRLIGGGAVSAGLPTRDSVLVHAAKGEFMMRRSSVESIGHDLLQDMNNRGAAALSRLGNSNLVMPQSNLQSSVYVVLPEEKPSLGPNDVLAVVNRDMLRGGTTKQLIKQIQAGG